MYYFTTDKECVTGDKVVVDFEEFQTIATVTRADVKFDAGKANELPKITRKATDADVKKFDELQKKAKSQLVAIKKKSVELGLMMKFVGAVWDSEHEKELREKCDVIENPREIIPLLEGLKIDK